MDRFEKIDIETNGYVGQKSIRKGNKYIDMNYNNKSNYHHSCWKEE